MTALQHDYASVNGIRLHYAHAGQGPLILFLHGFPEFWYCWKDQLAEFGRDHHAVAPDLRGYNLSDRPVEVKQYRSRILIEDIRQLALQLTDRKFVLVGHDWGGALAYGFAIAHPQMLRKLVVINAPHPWLFARDLAHDKAQQDASRYMNLLRSDKAERVLSENNYQRLVTMALEGWGRQGAGTSAADKAAYIEAWSQPNALTGGLNYYRASSIYPPTGNDPGAAALQLDPADFMVRVPTLVIWGMRDQALLSGSLEGLDQCVPDLSIVRLPDASHWVVHEEPATISRLIRHFVAR
ncbi:MAG: alpha/beta hydrolase [Betaproteobacteria bacterium]